MMGVFGGVFAEPKSEVKPGELTTILGKGTVFTGKLTFKGTVRIEGNFKGEIETTDNLQVGEEAFIDADIVCGAAVIRGTVQGNLTATGKVELLPPAKVTGTMHTASLRVEEGASFDGTCVMQRAAEVLHPQSAVNS